MEPGSLTFENGTHISWEMGDDGGGASNAHYVDFLNAIGKEKKYNNCLEWCAGLSAVAFSVLDANIAEKAVLMDFYEPALVRAQENAHKNNMGDRVSIRVCNKISMLPETDKFDLVVANPPQTDKDQWLNWNWTYKHLSQEQKDIMYRVCVDKDWESHKEFFKNITKYLTPNADIYISAMYVVDVILDSAKEGGLTLIELIPHPALGIKSKTKAVIYHFRYETEIY